MQGVIYWSQTTCSTSGEGVKELLPQLKRQAGPLAHYSDPLVMSAASC